MASTSLPFPKASSFFDGRLDCSLYERLEVDGEPFRRASSPESHISGVELQEPRRAIDGDRESSGYDGTEEVDVDLGGDSLHMASDLIAS